MKKEQMIEIFCSNIKALRKQRKLSKASMAKLMGICEKGLSDIEEGKLPPRLNIAVLFSIHRNFGISPSDINSKDFIETLFKSGN